MSLLWDPWVNEVEIDREALKRSLFLFSEDGISAADAEELILDYLSQLDSDDRNFSDEMFVARANFKRRCEAEPDECHSKIWEEVKREAYCGPPMSGGMTLDTAILILAESHTRDNDFSGFTVESHRDSCGRWTDHAYIEAWKTVRQHLHLKTEAAE